MKILIFIESNLYYRNFIISGAFDEIIKKHQTSFAYVKNPGASKYNVTDDIERQKINIAGHFKYSYKRAKKIYEFTVLNMVKLRHRCSTFMTRYKYQLSFKKRLFYLVLSCFLFYNIYKKLFIKILGIYKPIYNVINRVSPDLVIIPTSLIDSIAIDVILCCRRLKIKTLMLINGWDNISSKGTIPYMPDYLGVWGEQSKKHAIDIHNIPEEKIFILGAAQFNSFYREHKIDREEFLRIQKIPPNKKVILFAGSARVFDETDILLKLDLAIEKGELGDVHILYRPHPWRHKRLEEDSFFQHIFRHVSMDITIADVYRKHKEQADYFNLPSNVLPPLDYYPKLYGSIDMVICSLTTIIVEAAIFGLPVLAIAFSDNKHTLTMDKIISDKHFEDIYNIPGIIICRKRERFIEDCKKLVELTHDPIVKESLKKHIQYIVYSDHKTYGQRLLDYIDCVIFKDSIK